MATSLPPSPTKVLVVDDEPGIRHVLEVAFKRQGWDVACVPGTRTAIEALRQNPQPFPLVLTDLVMPDGSGIDVLVAAKERSSATEVVVMTAHSTVEAAIEAMRRGAYDFVTKPFSPAEIAAIGQKALEKSSIVAENRRLRAQIERLEHDHEALGTSPAMQRIDELVEKIARARTTVLITGESGTGKERVARMLHERSDRAGRPFVVVNCGALPEALMESELFGHEKGAFTGATGKKDGRFARAAGGTLFLDEIGELSPSVQVKLLRVLQEGEFEPLGGHTTKAAVRIVAATNRDLVAEVAAGRFREDLFYRLNVIAITAPPLRARREDIPLLVDHFLGLYCAKNGRPRLRPSPAVLARLMDYAWPGNVRELENVVERAVVLSRSDALSVSDLPEHIAESGPSAMSQLAFDIGTPLEEIELRVIRETLRHTKGDKSLAAQLLGISTRTIYRKLDGVAD